MKLLPFTLIWLGLAVALVILAVGFFRFFDPNMSETGLQNEYAAKLEAEGAKLPAQKKKVQEAIKLREETNAAWQDVVLAKTPADDLRLGGIDLSVNRYQLVGDSIRFRNEIQQDLNRQLKVGGVKVISGPRVPDFPSDPATIAEAGYGITRYPFPIRIYDFGQVTVEGTRQQIERNMAAWTEMPNYIAVADGLTYEGTSPKLRGNYNLSMVMYLRGRKVFPPAPLVATAGQPGAPGGGANPGLPGGAATASPVPAAGANR